METEIVPALRAEIGYLNNAAVRAEMSFLADSLARWLDLRNYGGDLPERARWRIAGRIDELLSAYRRHDRRLPPEPPWFKDYRDALTIGRETAEESFKIQQEHYIREREAKRHTAEPTERSSAPR